MKKINLILLLLLSYLPLAHGQLESRNHSVSNQFYAYKPMYFVFGTSPFANAKFQLSFKYRIFAADTFDGLAAPVDKLYLGYTQKSFWDIGDSSGPIRDSVYNPEVFYLRRNIGADYLPGAVSCDLQFGLEHLSNGASGGESRQWNRAYIWPWVRFGQPQHWHVTVAPKVWATVEDSENPNIEKTYGYGELHVGTGMNEGLWLDVMARQGVDSDARAAEVELSYPLKHIFNDNLKVNVFVQGFFGRGDSLLDDEEDTHDIRIGFSVVR